MSDLSATNCGCGCENNACSNTFGGNNCIWIILLLLCCGGNCGNTTGNCDCLWIILLLLFCGGNFGCGNGISGNCGCGC